MSGPLSPEKNTTYEQSAHNHMMIQNIFTVSSCEGAPESSLREDIN